MPIVFAQPEAYDKNISQAYGAAQALKDFAPFLQRAYGGGGGGGRGGGGGGPAAGWGFGGLGGGGGGGGDGGVQMQQDPLALYQGQREIDRYYQQQDQQQAIDAINQNIAREMSPEDQAQLQDLRTRANTEAPTTARTAADEGTQSDESGEAVPTPEFQAQQQARQAQQAQAPPPQPPEFTQSDALNLQRLQAAESGVQNDLRSGKIDRASANQLIARIRQGPAGIMALRAQQQAAQTQASQVQLQRAQADAAHATAIEDTNTRMRAQTGLDMTREIPGLAGRYQWNARNQMWEPLKESDRVANRQENAHQIAQAEATAFSEIEKAVRAEAEHARTEGVRNNRAAVWPDWHDGPTLEGSIEREVRRRFRQRQQFLGPRQGAFPQSPEQRQQFAEPPAASDDSQSPGNLPPNQLRSIDDFALSIFNPPPPPPARPRFTAPVGASIGSARSGLYRAPGG